MTRILMRSNSKDIREKLIMDKLILEKKLENGQNI